MCNLVKIVLWLALLSSPVFSLEYNFAKGWNLFSPIISQPVVAKEWLAGQNILDNVSRIWSFGGNGVSGWDSFTPDNTTFKLEPGLGYWFYMKNACTINLSDEFSSFQVNVVGTGWRLLGTNCSDSINLDDEGFFNPLYLTGDKSHVRRILSFAAGNWTYFSHEQNSSLAKLSPGLGYWFYLNDSFSVDSIPDLSSLMPPTCPGCGFPSPSDSN